MKKLFFAATMLLAAVVSSAQGILDRYSEPGSAGTVFIPKGNKAIGISGGYRSINVGGEDPLSGDGYAILSMLNIGNGEFNKYNVSPSFSFFIADDLSLDVRLDYSGYKLETDLKLDLRKYNFLDELFGEEHNYTIASRSIKKNSWGVSMALRKYQSFFGSRTFGVFGELRLFGEYSKVTSCPTEDFVMETYIDEETGEEESRKVHTSETIYRRDQERVSNIFSTGLKLAAGVAVKLKDNSALTVSIPIIGATYGYTKQHKEDTDSNAHISQFNISRDIDFISIQIGYVRYFTAK